MTEKDVIVGLNNIAAKYGYGKGTEPFTNDEWNTIFCAKLIIKDYAKLTAENDNLTVELEVAQRDVDNLTRTLEECTEEFKAEKHRSEVAERQAVVLSKWLAEKTKKDYPWRAWFDAAQKQAEKELAEEIKDD